MQASSFVCAETLSQVLWGDAEDQLCGLDQESRLGSPLRVSELARASRGGQELAPGRKESRMPAAPSPALRLLYAERSL